MFWSWACFASSSEYCLSYTLSSVYPLPNQTSFAPKKHPDWQESYLITCRPPPFHPFPTFPRSAAGACGIQSWPFRGVDLGVSDLAAGNLGVTWKSQRKKQKQPGRTNWRMTFQALNDIKMKKFLQYLTHEQLEQPTCDLQIFDPTGPGSLILWAWHLSGEILLDLPRGWPPINENTKAVTTGRRSSKPGLDGMKVPGFV